LAGAHDALAVHALQAPPLHTWFVPQAVPSPTLVPVSSHTGAPVEQLTVPVWQAFGGVHEAPTVHPEQLPLSQTRFVPHVTPFATSLPVSAQTAAPVVQTTLPMWHGFDSSGQLVPDEHDVHASLLQT